MQWNRLLLVVSILFASQSEIFCKGGSEGDDTLLVHPDLPVISPETSVANAAGQSQDVPSRNVAVVHDDNIQPQEPSSSYDLVTIDNSIGAPRNDDGDAFTQLAASSPGYIPGLVGRQPKKLCWLLQQFSLKTTGKTFFLNRALLYGPPGNGKSVTARIFAEQSGSVFLARSACSMVEKYVGQGATNVVEMFNAAAELLAEGKRVVLFIDEIDSLASSNNTEFRTEHKAALQQLWLELDNYKHNPNIFIIFATNEFKKLSKTLLDRVGSNTIEVKHPKAQKRKQVIKYYAKKVDIKLKNSEIDNLVAKTKGLSVRSVEDLIMAMRMAADVDNNGKVTKKIMLAELALIRKKFAENTSEEKDPKETPLQKASSIVSIVGTSLQAFVTMHTLINIAVRMYEGAPLFGLTPTEHKEYRAAAIAAASEKNLSQALPLDGVMA